MKILTMKEAFEDFQRNDSLRDFFVWWDRNQEGDVELIRNAIDSATREEDIQQFLQKNPRFLIQHLGGGHGRWVLPKQKMGSEFVTDFMIGEKHSFGYGWQAVELESPLKRMFNKNGDPSQHLNHAIRQILDWRSWLVKNQNYAARSRDEHGLGLTDIDGNVPGLIIIGRRSDSSGDTVERRRQMVVDLNIQIHTYDFLIEAMLGRLRGSSLLQKEKIADET